MRKTKADRGEPAIDHEEGSGNVFADLGLPEADQLLSRAKLGFHVYELLKARGLGHEEMGGLLGIGESEVSHLMNGHFNRFTTDHLLDFLRRLDRKVTIRVAPRKPGEPYQEVGFGA